MSAKLKYLAAWCVKYVKPVLVGEVAERLEAAIREKAEGIGVDIKRVEVSPGQVIIYLEAPPTITPHLIIKHLKSHTSNQLRKEFPRLRSSLPTLWNLDYYVATLGRESPPAIKRFLKTQKPRS